MIADERPERSGAQRSELETTRQMIADEHPERSGAKRSELETARQMIADERPERSGAQRSELETTRQMMADEHPERSGAKRSAVEGRAPISEAPPTALRSAQGASSTGRVIAVFGSAGLRDVEKRRLMAETSVELADVTVLTAEDPRSESLDAILAMMAASAARAGGAEGKTFFRIPDRGEAIRLALGLAHPGDVVLACGKGHEQSMCFGTTEYPWDDRTAMRAALAELLGTAGPEMPRLPTSRALNH